MVGSLSYIKLASSPPCSMNACYIFLAEMQYHPVAQKWQPLSNVYFGMGAVCSRNAAVIMGVVLRATRMVRALGSVSNPGYVIPNIYGDSRVHDNETLHAHIAYGSFHVKSTQYKANTFSISIILIQ